MFTSGNGGSMDGIPALGANLAVITNGVGTLTTSITTATEISYVSGVTGPIQAQIDAKQPVGNYITALTGDATANGPGSVPITLATVNGSPGSFGSASSTLTATVNGKGLVTAMAAVAISIDMSQVPTGSLSFTRVTGTVPIAQGGTGQTTKAAAFDALSPMTTGGDIIYGGASGTGTRLANGLAGQVLQSNGTTLAPTWVTPAPNALTMLTTLSNTKTPSGSGNYHAMTNNSLTLTRGSWILYSQVNFNSSGGSAVYGAAGLGIYAANGADSGVVPALLSTLPNLTVNSAVTTENGSMSYNSGLNNSIYVDEAVPLIVTVTANTTVYLVPISFQTTSANARITAAFNALKIQS